MERKQQLWEVEGGASWAVFAGASCLAAALSVLLFPDHHKVSSSVPPHTPCHEVLPNRKGAS